MLPSLRVYCTPKRIYVFIYVLFSTRTLLYYFSSHTHTQLKKIKYGKRIEELRLFKIVEINGFWGMVLWDMCTHSKDIRYRGTDQTRNSIGPKDSIDQLALTGQPQMNSMLQHRSKFHYWQVLPYEDSGAEWLDLWMQDYLFFVCIGHSVAFHLAKRHRHAAIWRFNPYHFSCSFFVHYRKFNIRFGGPIQFPSKYVYKSRFLVLKCTRVIWYTSHHRETHCCIKKCEQFEMAKRMDLSMVATKKNTVCSMNAINAFKNGFSLKMQICIDNRSKSNEIQKCFGFFSIFRVVSH